MNLFPEKQIVGAYELISKLCQGSFGEVYLANQLHSNEHLAVKLEHSCNFILLQEAKILMTLQNVQGIPRVYSHGSEYKLGKYFIALQLLDNDLEHYFKRQKQQFSLRTILNISYSLIEIIQQIHEKGILHRDIKPDNIMFSLSNEVDQNGIKKMPGNSSPSNLFIVDFSISKYFKKNGAERKFKNNKQFIGTIRFASLAAHCGQEQSQKDDLESLGYMLVYFFKGNLPWQEINRARKDERIKAVGEMKQKTPIEQLCFGMPKCFLNYFKYIKSLQYGSVPNYEQLKQSFKQALESTGQILDYQFDWIENLRTKQNNSMSVAKVGQKKSHERRQSQMGQRLSVIMAPLNTSNNSILLDRSQKLEASSCEGMNSKLTQNSAASNNSVLQDKNQGFMLLQNPNQPNDIEKSSQNLLTKYRDQQEQVVQKMFESMTAGLQDMNEYEDDLPVEDKIRDLEMNSAKIRLITLDD